MTPSMDYVDNDPGNVAGFALYYGETSDTDDVDMMIKMGFADGSCWVVLQRLKRVRQKANTCSCVICALIQGIAIASFVNREILFRHYTLSQQTG